MIELQPLVSGSTPTLPSTFQLGRFRFPIRSSGGGGGGGGGNLGALAGLATGPLSELANLDTAHALAAQMANQYWGDDQDPALMRILDKESGGRWNAANPRSSARGPFQQMTSIHGPLAGDRQGIVQWGLDYIRGRYGSPSQALAFHNRRGWY